MELSELVEQAIANWIEHEAQKKGKG